MDAFDELQERVFALYGQQRFEQMRELLAAAPERFPHRCSRVTYWQACVDSLLGEPEKALQRLRDGAEQAPFWAEESLHTPRPRGRPSPTGVRGHAHGRPPLGRTREREPTRST